MTQVNVTNVKVLDNPAPFTSPFRFEITFECYPPGLQEELEWKLIYVGSAEDSKCDQELDSVLVGPVSVGKNVFIFEAPAPDPALIPEKDLMDITVIILSALYREKEFIRIGYYVNNEYSADHPQLKAEWDQYKAALDYKLQQEQAQLLHQQQLQLHLSDPTQPPPPSDPPVIPPQPVQPRAVVGGLMRNVSEQPRVTRFPIAWDDREEGVRLEGFVMEGEDERRAREEERKGEEDKVKEGEGREVKRRKVEEGGKEEKVQDDDDDDDDEVDEDEDDDDAIVDLSGDEEKPVTAVH